MARGFRVIQGLVVGDVQVSSSGEIRILLRNATTQLGPITWPATHECERMLREWMDAATPVTYVKRGREVALVDEHRLLERAFAD